MPKEVLGTIKIETKNVPRSIVWDLGAFGGGEPKFRFCGGGRKLDLNSKAVRSVFGGLAWQSVRIQLRLWSLQILQDRFSTLRPWRKRRSLALSAHSDGPPSKTESRWPSGLKFPDYSIVCRILLTQTLITIIFCSKPKISENYPKCSQGLDV